MARTVDELLAEARQRLQRLDALDASARVSRGALLIDTRPEWQRREHGSVPGALVIDRNHLEWRLDPACEYRIPEVDNHDVDVIVICQEGFSSSMAAATLQALGLRHRRHRGRRRVEGRRTPDRPLPRRR